MANEEQLAILRQGVDVWNKWREENRFVEVDFTGANLSSDVLNRANLQSVQLRDADLRQTHLIEADLSRAKLNGANLNGVSLLSAKLFSAELIGSNLSDGDLSGSDFFSANLTKANLSRSNAELSKFDGAHLIEADLTGTDISSTTFRGASLDGANLTEANLTDALLIGTNLNRATFYHTKIGYTVFEGIDLCNTRGLEDVVHQAPSHLGIDTIYRSKGKIPTTFLRGCGLSDWEIEMVKLYSPNLGNEERNKVLYKIYDLQASQAIQISPLFISYNRSDSDFVDKVSNHLAEKGIRYWRDIHDLKAGKVERQIDMAIRQNPTVLLVLSEHSLASDWVEHEVRKARELGKELGRDTLCPVALDDSWKSSTWPKRLMEQIMEYNILDFSEWEDDSKFDSMFRKLLDGLELFYKG